MERQKGVAILWKEKTDGAMYGEAEHQELQKIAEKYKKGLDIGKTERECIQYTVKEIEAQGYRSLESFWKSGETLKSGDKVYTSLHEEKYCHVSYWETALGKWYEYSRCTH